jgi:hypothetical protein
MIPRRKPAAFLFCLSVSLLTSHDSPLYAAAGKDGFVLAGMTESPRSAAMAGSAAALADEAASSLENPAALGVLRAREAQAGYASLPESLSHASLSYLHPFAESALGLHAQVLDYGDIVRYDGFDERGASFGARETLLAAGWGRSFGRSWAAGLNVRQAALSIDGKSASALAADLGLLRRQGRFTLSAGVRNAGGRATFVRDATALPRAMHAGAAARFFSEAWAVSGEWRRSSDGEASLHVGQEIWVHNALAIRAGWRSDRDLGGTTFGFGIKLKAVRLDYAFSPLGEAFGQSHRAGLSFRFGGAGERAYEEGLQAAQRGHHAEAILKFKAALDADPAHKAAVRALRESVTALEKERGAAK